VVIAWRKVVAGAEDSLQGVVDERAEESVASFERRAGVLRKLLRHCTGAIVDSRARESAREGAKVGTPARSRPSESPLPLDSARPVSSTDLA